MKSPWYYNWHLKKNAVKVHKIVAVSYAIGMLLTFINFTLYYSVQPAFAAALTWDGGGSTNSWSECANWTTDACPGSSDAVTFNGTSTKDATVDASFTGVITSLAISSGYTGTITLARSLQTTSTFNQAAGTFTAAGQTLDVDSTFTLSAGTFTASSGTITLGGALTVSGSPTFNANGGTVTFDSTSGTLTCNNVTFNLVTFNNSGQSTVSSSCSLPLGSGPTLAGAGAIANSGALSGSGTLTKTSSTLSMSTGSSLSGFSAIAVSSFTVAGASLDLSSYTSFTSTSSVAVNSGSLTPPNAGTFTSGGTFTVAGGTFSGNGVTLDLNGALTISSGTFTAPSGTMTVAGGITYTAGTFNHNNGTVTLDGSSATINCGAMVFNLVTMTAGKTLSSGCNLPLGANPTITTLTTSGTLSGTGTLTATGFISNSGASLSGFSGITVNGSLTVQGATYDLSSYTTYTVTGTTTVSSGSLTLGSGMSIATFTQSGGTFNAPSGTLTINSTFNVSAGTFNANGGTINFGTSTATLTCTGVTFNSVVFATASNTKTVGSSCTMPLGSNPTIGGPISNSGTLSGTGTATFSSTLTWGTTGSLSGFSGLVMGNTLTMSGGTANLGSYTTVDLNGALTLTSGTITAPSGTMTIAGAVTYTAGTFNHNSGTVVLDGASGTIACGSMSFNLVQLNYTSTKTMSSGCTLPLGANPTIPTTIVLSGTLSGTGTLTMASNTLTANSGAVISGFTGFSKGAGTGSLTVAGADLNFSAYTSTVFNGFTISSGSFIAPSGTMSTTTFTSNGGTFTANGGTVNFPLSGTTTCTGGATFNLVTITHASSARTFVNCTVPLGSNPTNFYQTTLTNSTLSGTGTLTFNGALTLGSGSALSGFTRLVANNQVILSGGTLDFSGYDVVDINERVTMSSGTLTASPGTMTMSNNLTATGGTFNHNNGTIMFDGAAATIACNGMLFHRVDVESTSTKTFNSDCTMPFGDNPVIRGAIVLKGRINGTGRLISDAGSLIIDNGGSLAGFNALTTHGAFQLNGGTADFGSYTNMDINGALTLAGGTFIAPQVLSVSNNWTRTTGVFFHNNGTVDLDGNDQTIIGSNTFYNLTKAPQGGASLAITGNTIQTVKGKLTMTGKATDRRLNLISSNIGSVWQIDPQGDRAMRNLSVRDGFNISSTKINLAGSGSNDNGNNTGWLWFIPTIDTLGPTSLIDGSTGASATPTVTFTTADQDKNDTISYTIQIDDSADFSSAVVDYTSALASGGNLSFTVGQAVGTGAYTVGSAGQTLKDGSYYWRVRASDNNGSVSDWQYANTTKESFTVGSTTTSTTAPTTADNTGSTSSESSTVAATTATNASQAAVEDNSINVELKVRFLDDLQKPVVGAQVTLYSEPRHAVTDSDGVAVFADVPTGEHRVVITYNGKVGEKQITVTGSAQNDIDVAASPIPVDLTIQLKDTKPVTPAFNYYILISMALITVIAVLLLLRHLHYKKQHQPA